MSTETMPQLDFLIPASQATLQGNFQSITEYQASAGCGGGSCASGSCGGGGCGSL